MNLTKQTITVIGYKFEMEETRYQEIISKNGGLAPNDDLMSVLYLQDRCNRVVATIPGMTYWYCIDKEEEKYYLDILACPCDIAKETLIELSLPFLKRFLEKEGFSDKFIKSKLHQRLNIIRQIYRINAYIILFATVQFLRGTSEVAEVSLTYDDYSVKGEFNGKMVGNEIEDDLPMEITIDNMIRDNLPLDDLVEEIRTWIDN